MMNDQDDPTALRQLHGPSAAGTEGPIESDPLLSTVGSPPLPTTIATPPSPSPSPPQCRVALVDESFTPTSADTDLSSESTSAEKHLLKPRLFSIDVMRTLAIFIMVLKHYTLYITDESLASSFWKFVDYLGMTAAPFFLFLVGACQASSLHKQSSCSTFSSMFIRLSKRVLIILAVSAFLTLCNWDITAFWDVLTTIALAYLITGLISRLSCLSLSLGCLLILVISPPLRYICQYDRFYISFDEFESDLRKWPWWLFFTVFFVNGYIPLLPWYFFVLMGYISGKLSLVNIDSVNNRPEFSIAITGLALTVCGVLFACFSLLSPGESTVSPALFYTSPVTFYPPSTSYVSIYGGFACILFAVLRLTLDKKTTVHSRLVLSLNCCRGIVGFFSTFVVVISRYSLSIYVLHLVPLLIFQGIYHAVTNDWPEILLPYSGPLIGFGVFSVLFLLMWAWHAKLSGTGTFEWLLSKIS